MKQCSTCRNSKPQACFYRAARSPDGLKSQCKDCHQESSIRTRDKTKHQDANRAHMRRARVADPQKFRDRERRASALRKKGPRTAARVAVHSALRSGKLTRPDECERCASRGRLNAHHDDYDKPLDVEWLCYECHGEEHRE